MTAPVPVVVDASWRPVRPALPSRAPAAIATGLLAGAAWGIVARVWMRFISAAPEFTLNGTLGVIGIFAVFGLGQALAAVARRDRWRRGGRLAARGVALATTLPLGLAAGALMLPSTILAAVALARMRMRPRLRLVLALAAFVPTLLQLRQLADELPPWRAGLGWLLMFAIYAPLVLGLAATLRPLDGDDDAADRDAGQSAAAGAAEMRDGA